MKKRPAVRDISPHKWGTPTRRCVFQTVAYNKRQSNHDSRLLFDWLAKFWKNEKMNQLLKQPSSFCQNGDYVVSHCKSVWEKISLSSMGIFTFGKIDRPENLRIAFSRIDEAVKWKSWMKLIWSTFQCLISLEKFPQASSLQKINKLLNIVMQFVTSDYNEK